MLPVRESQLVPGTLDRHFVQSRACLIRISSVDPTSFVRESQPVPGALAGYVACLRARHAQSVCLFESFSQSSLWHSCRVYFGSDLLCSRVPVPGTLDRHFVQVAVFKPMVSASSMLDAYIMHGSDLLCSRVPVPV